MPVLRSSPSPPETNNNVQETIKKADAKFRILSDLDHRIMDAYDVTFRVTDAYNERIERGKGESIEENNGDEEPYLPVPATYIINQDGDIIYRQFDPNYRNRASIAAMIKALE
jgi:peroxiredoxin